MKLLLDVFERLRPQFQDDGKLRPFKPMFDAMENFFFSSLVSTKTAPYIRDPLDLKRYMSVVIIGLLPCTAAAFYFFGWRVLAMIIVSYAAGGAAEVAFAIIRKEEINEGLLVTGLLFPLILPPGLPLWMVAVGVVFGVVVGKELFGGTARNLFNPALVGRCFLLLGYPAAMGSNWITPGSGLTGRLLQYAGSWQVDAVSEATPLVAAAGGSFLPLWDMFCGRTAGSVGETSVLAIAIGGIFLLVTRVGNWRTTVGVLGSFAGLQWLLHLMVPGSFGEPIWQLLAGGLMFGAFFMATDPVTSPITNGGKWAYAVLIGAITVLIRNLTGYVEGVMFAILLGNIAAPVLDEVVFRHRFRRLAYEG